LPSEVAEAELKQIIEDKESTMSFNISHIEDINEKILFESTGKFKIIFFVKIPRNTSFSVDK